MQNSLPDHYSLHGHWENRGSNCSKHKAKKFPEAFCFIKQAPVGSIIHEDHSSSLISYCYECTQVQRPSVYASFPQMAGQPMQEGPERACVADRGMQKKAEFQQPICKLDGKTCVLLEDLPSAQGADDD